MADGSVKQLQNVFRNSIKVFTPRVGLAWDPTGKGTWVVRGGFGIYRDWPTLGIDENSLKGNPPGFVLPTFLTGTTNPPIFAVGSSDKYPFGYPYPSLPPSSLDEHGGLAGAQLTIGGVDPNLSSERTYTYVGSLQHEFPGKLVVSAGYSGSHSVNQLTGSVLNQFPGTDINRFAGDLIVNSGTLTRLNPSFGAINYTTTGAKATYNAFIATAERRFSSGRITASYTRSTSSDYGQSYPDQHAITQYWQPSIYDVPNRFAFTGSYEIPVHKMENGAANVLLRGWQIAATSIAQSGLPFTVFTNAPFEAGGDYNADGYNYDWPDVNRSYSTPSGAPAFLNGIFSAGDFVAPTPGQEGNEKPGRFRGPGFFNVDASAIKNTHITERVSLEFRFEFLNLFNRLNLNGFDSNLADGSFGQSTAVFNPRWIQLGAKISF